MKRIKMTSKKWVLTVLVVVWSIFIGSAVLVIVIDPYLHYRIPNNGFDYMLAGNERCLADGFIRHCNYDAVIAGTSMTQNFKSSELNKLFDVNSIKVPVSGGSYRDVSIICKRALEVQPDIKLVLRGIDLSMLSQDKNASSYSIDLEYMHNEKVADDINYWLNKMTILEGCLQNVILHSMSAKLKGTYQCISMPDVTFFDKYGNWQADYTFGRDSVLAAYERPEKSDDIVSLTQEEKEIIRENVTQNVTELACAYPNTMFILFFPPYSICYWDSLVREGKLEWEREAQKIAIEEILKYDNIKLYSFCNNFKMVCDLNNYKDAGHYSEKVNSLMLGWMREGEYRLTLDNYENYLQELYDFYREYDYDVIFEPAYLF